MQRRRFMTAGIGAGASAAIGAAVALPRPQPGATVRGALLADGRRLYAGAALAFGTTMSVQVAHDNEREALLAIDAALAAAGAVDQLMTLHRDDSQVRQLNLHGVLAQPDARLMTVLKFARQLSRQTDGAFDITVQPLWELYAAAAARDSLPEQRARHAAMAQTGWRRMTLGPDRVVLEPGMAITLNGVAQGYAVDLARQSLNHHGIRSALLDTGEFGARGEKTLHNPWTIGVRDPRNAAAMVGIVPMDQRCVATSGDYETVFSDDYAHHHIFDPATGDSPTQLASVTVLAPTGLQADGWSTAFMVLGRQRAIELTAQLRDVDLLLVDKSGGVWRSAGFPAGAG
jgi:thiamine biosynthesis lipoprotein